MSDSQLPGADSVPPVPPAPVPASTPTDDASAEEPTPAASAETPDAAAPEAAAPAVHPAVDAPPAPPAPPAPSVVNPYVQTPIGGPASPNPYVTPTQLPVSQVNNPFSSPTVPTFGQQPPQPAPGAPVSPPVYPPALQPQMAAPQSGVMQPGTPQPGFPQAPGHPAPYPYPGQAPMHGAPAPAVPGYAGYMPGVAPPPSTFNVLGLVSLILGAFGLLIGLVPFVGMFGGLMALVGVILGIIGWVAKNKAKGLAIAGTIVSGLALILSVAVSVFFFSMFSQPYSSGDWSDEYDDSDTWIAEDPAALDDSDLGGIGPGSSSEPFALGEAFIIADGDQQYWELAVGEPTLDGTADVAAASEYNDTPPDGYQYVIVPITYTYLGEDVESAWLDFYLHVSGSDGVAYPDSYIYIYPDHVTDADDLATGETATLVTMFLVKSDAVDGSLLKITHWDAGTVYVALG